MAPKEIQNNNQQKHHTENRYSVYFGGSFDPPHKGHHQILNYLLNSPAVEEIFLVPTSINPLKKSTEKIYSDKDIRRQWIELWIKETEELLQKSTVRLTPVWSELEKGRQVPSYTDDTLGQLQQSYPERNWILCLGFDSVLTLHKWKNIRELLTKLERVWVFPRKGYDWKLESVVHDLKEFCQFDWVECELPGYSSSDVREALRNENYRLVLEACLPSIAKNIKKLL